MPIHQMPDEALVALEEAGFRADVRGESLVASLSRRPVRRSEVAEVLGCEAEDLTQTGRAVQVTFAPSGAAPSAQDKNAA